MEEKDVKLNKNNFIYITQDSLTDYYEVTRFIGAGGYGKVYEVKSLKTQEFFACKKLSKINIIDLSRFREEINIMSTVDHPNIVKLYEIYESQRSFYLIMELCKGGELLKKINKRIKYNNIYTEKDAAKIFRQIMSGIEYCHNQGICHRDIKPENILYLKDDNEIDNPIKIIDFGLSRHFKFYRLISKVGSVYYIPPEIISQNYTEKCDIWSAGVLLYLLLSGNLPFKGEDHKEIVKNILSLNYNMDDKIWKNISNEAKDLIKHMIIPENERFNGKEVLSHPWFKKVQNINNEKLNIDINIIEKYTEKSAIKRIVLFYIATRLNDDEIEELKKIFKEFDMNFDGQISYEEFKKGFMKYQNKNQNQALKYDFKNIFDMVDMNKNGVIDYSEFIAACLIGKKTTLKKGLLEAFSSYDTNNSGKIKKEDFIKALHIDTSIKEKGFDKVINDSTKNNYIDYKDFLKILEE